MTKTLHRSDSVTETLDSRAGSPVWLTVLIVIVLVAIVLAAFWPALNGAFLNWDDDRNFVENPDYRGLGIKQSAWALRTYHLGVWQPLSWMLLGLQYELGEMDSAGGAESAGGMDPAIYHQFSLILHAINVVVFYLMAVALLQAGLRQTGRATTAVCVCSAAMAMLFAVHPLRVEVVSWVSCQPYLPAALFYMLAVLAYVQGRRRAESPRSWYKWLAVVFACYLLGVASKAVVVSLPAVLLILDVYPLGRWGGPNGWLSRPGLRVWIEKLPFFAVAVVVSVLAAAAKDYSDSRMPFSVFDADAQLAQSAYGLIFYLFKTMAPVNLIPYYRLPDDLDLATLRFGLCAAVVLAVTIGLAVLRRRWPAVLAMWVAYIVILLPNLGIVQISQQIATDRYSYLAIMPVMVLLAGAMLKMWQSRGRHRIAIRSALLTGVCAITLIFTLASRRQTGVWNNSIALWKATLALDPDCAVAECNLGVALLTKQQYVEASRHISKAIDLDRDFAWAYSNLGTILLEANRFKDAAVCFERALDVEPPLSHLDRAKAHAGLGAACAGLGQYDSAWRHTRRAQQMGLEVAQKMIDYLKTVSEEPKDSTQEASTIQGGED
ncbi:MAG: tetratricopeptide repeat protein [Phycisphaerae bacterium]|nr:tetratricopeptide repeat protein [Phycisphaerae bacterium]